MSILQTNQSIYFNVYNWKKSDVDSWVKGLDASIAGYFPLNIENYDGKWLMNATLQDLKWAGIDKIGHALLLLDSVKLLSSEVNNFSNDTLQNALFIVSIDATFLNNLLDKLIRANQSLNEYPNPIDEKVKNMIYLYRIEDIQQIKMTVVSSVLKLTMSIKNAVDWMNKPSFSHNHDLLVLKKELMEYMKRVNFYTQMFITDKADDKLPDIKGMSNWIIMCTTSFIDGIKDSLYLTPCIIDSILIHKAENMIFGINVRMTSDNRHFIESIDMNTPAYNVGKLEEGDEILEINNQIVIGWQHQKVIDELRSHQKKLCLRLRKKPMHFNDGNFVGGGVRRKLNLSGGGMTGGSNHNLSTSRGANGLPVNLNRSGILSRPSKRVVNPSGCVSTPATPVLVSKSQKTNQLPKDLTTEPLQPQQVDSSQALSTDSIGQHNPLQQQQQQMSSSSAISEALKIEEAAGSGGEYSAADKTPNILCKYQHRNHPDKSGSVATTTLTTTTLQLKRSNANRLPNPIYDEEFLSPPTFRKSVASSSSPLQHQQRPAIDDNSAAASDVVAAGILDDDDEDDREQQSQDPHNNSTIVKKNSLP